MILSEFFYAIGVGCFVASVGIVLAAVWACHRENVAERRAEAWRQRFDRGVR